MKNPRIIIGDYTYFDDIDGANRFEEHVTHLYEFIGDRLIIGNVCDIAKGVTFVTTAPTIGWTVLRPTLSTEIGEMRLLR